MQPSLGPELAQQFRERAADGTAGCKAVLAPETGPVAQSKAAAQQRHLQNAQRLSQ
jgi:hypothetical protein